MSKPKLLLIAYRAYGDWLYTIPVLPYLFKEYDIYLETNYKIYNLVYNDERFVRKEMFLYEELPKDQWNKIFPTRWNKVINELKPDRVINLNGSLEVECILERFQDEFYWPVKKRQDKFGARNFYNSVFKRCGVPIPQDIKLDVLYYSQKEIDIVEKWRNKHQDQFIILMPIAGSTSQKVLHMYKSWTEEILRRFPQAVVYLSGDRRCQHLVPKDNSRIIDMCVELPIKQAYLMAKYANYVLGPETGLLVAAGMWGTHKTMLCTTSSTYQTVLYHKNDHSIQAPVACSPCHKAIYYDTDCDDMRGDLKTKVVYPVCTKSFDFNQILPDIEEVYKRWEHVNR